MGEVLIFLFTFIGICFVVGFITNFFDGSVEKKEQDGMHTILKGIVVLSAICLVGGFIVAIVMAIVN